MDWVLENWYIILALMAIGCLSGYCVSEFIKQPTSTKVENIKEWLKYAVMEAERQLGGGTGQAKLRLVYDMAVTKFEWLSFVSFQTFSSWVDEALQWLENQLSTNENIKKYIEK